MRQVWITRRGGPEVLQVREAPDPEPGEGEVRIRVKASGINFADLMARVGLYPDAPKIPCVVGYEVSGTVERLGAGVTGFTEGERVIAMPRFGGYSDVVVAPKSNVMKMPGRMTFEEGAALPVVYLTAYDAMLFTGTIREGLTVFIHSAAGGVGLAAIDLAKTRGCRIIGTASSSKHAFLRERGLEHPIDSSGDYVSAVRAIVGDRGVDLILDPVGGDSWTKGYELLAPCGRLVAYGLSAAAAGTGRNLFKALGAVMGVKKWSPMSLMSDNKTITGVNMGHLFSRPDLLHPQFAALFALYEQGALKPYVSKTFSFDKAGDAHQFIHDRKAIGKVLLIP